MRMNIPVPRGLSTSRLGHIQLHADIAIDRAHGVHRLSVDGWRERAGGDQAKDEFPHVGLPNRTGCEAVAPILLVTLARHWPTVVVAGDVVRGQRSGRQAGEGVRS